ncbi:MAG TPA: hypothetical protein GXZ95_02215 [Mollicutes bacterium]|nr:hypothetical protein [Mollicutes bacterium]
MVDYVVNESDYILRVRIFENDNPFPISLIKVQVLEVLKGNFVPEIIDISQSGGYVTIKQLWKYNRRENTKNGT